MKVTHHSRARKLPPITVNNNLAYYTEHLRFHGKCGEVRKRTSHIFEAWKTEATRRPLRLKSTTSRSQHKTSQSLSTGVNTFVSYHSQKTTGCHLGTPCYHVMGFVISSKHCISRHYVRKSNRQLWVQAHAH